VDVKKRNDQLLVDGSRLREILDRQLAVLGHAGLDALYYEMENHGFVFDSGRTYSIAQIELFFRMMVGEDAAKIALDRIKRELMSGASQENRR
jgi:hypothetical protein